MFFGAGGLDRWQISAAGDLTQDATNGGNIVMAKAGTGLTYAQTTDDVVSAAGSTQADATAMTVNRIQIATGANGTTGIKFLALASLTRHATYSIWNDSASALKLYTNAAGEFINDIAGTTAYSIPAYTKVDCYAYDAANFYCG
jgi:hypothetical protein